MESMYYIVFMVEILLFILISYFMFVEESSTKPQELTNEHLGNYRIAVPLISINLILFVLSAYGGHRLDYYVVNTTTPTITYSLLSSPISDYSIWAIVFLSLFLIHVLLLFKCIFDYMRESTFDRKSYYRNR